MYITKRIKNPFEGQGGGELLGELFGMKRI